MLLIGILVFGLAVGGLAQLVMGRASTRIDWGMALVAGLVGSFVGGLLISLIAGDGVSFRPSGVIGSLLGALIVSFVWLRLDAAKAAEARSNHR
jgi:uncharacterized membrane protein YeaQ/YmgE (transglycosylase-associated protein family)